MGLLAFCNRIIQVLMIIIDFVLIAYRAYNISWDILQYSYTLLLAVRTLKAMEWKAKILIVRVRSTVITAN